MSEIKKGDLVIVIAPRHCCGANRGVGKILQVVRRPNNILTQCPDCGSLWSSADEWFLSDGHVCRENRMRRIDPPKMEEKTITERPIEQV